ncbi:M13 family metallopeptidase [Steroidobacter sp.]|uniref:M13 family metallopeptidase n=1 Tax=Steroidobacter sp. TaxID=1978227 RepID=UPI001A3DE1C4|nr:M13 family metallopeptidase [Steroidobacter sp.]MBL8264896.1 M13 family metallopeptidase [Steroidobacter sp.]
MTAKPVLAVLSCTLVLAACSSPPATAPTPSAPATFPLRSGVYGQNLDKNVRPQDDFYRFVNGQWLASTSIPPDRSNFGAFALLEDGAEHDLKAILDEAAAANAPAGSDAQKVGDLYASYLDEATIESRGLTPLAGELKRIDELKTKQDVARYIGYSQRISLRHPFAYYVSVDRKNSSQYTGIIAQSGLGMPDRDYYLSDDLRLKGIREQYQVYVKELLAAAGTPKAESVATKIFGIEAQLAKSHWTRVQNRDAQKTYNRYEVATLPKLMPGFDWEAFFAGAQIPAAKTQALVVVQPSYFEALGKVIATTSVSDWRGYFRYKLLNAYAPDLPAKFTELHFGFNQRAVSGIEAVKPRWKRAVDTVDGAVGDLIGKMYVERHFSPDARRRMDELVANLMRAYAQGIDSLEWMTPATKQKAHAKLALFTTKIGYPTQWRDWSQLEIRRDDLVGNEMRASVIAFERNLGKLGGPIDRTEWFMTPQTVNAYYNPPTNEIVFPAAILQPPFFNVAADDALNYGAIGAVIGHEISHGFDDQGRRYDGTGNLNDWWAPEDNAEFTRRAKQLGAQYSALSPLPGLNVKGDLTMGENIADLAGLAMAYRAWQLSLRGQSSPVIDGYTGEQRFFIGWAQGWARKYRDDELRRRLLTDPHSPSEYRTNTVVSNLPEFHAAFGVQPGDKMYKAPAERVKLW